MKHTRYGGGRRRDVLDGGMTTRIRVPAAVVVLLATAVLACTNKPPPAPGLGAESEREQTTQPNAGSPPVVVVVFDELPLVSLLAADRRIDAATYPAFARLAGDATWYRNATSAHGFTANAVPAILTGRYTREEQLPVARDHPANLFASLDGEYGLHVEEALTNLCVRDVCAGNDKRFRGFAAAARRHGKHDAFIDIYEEMRDDDLPGGFARFVAGVTARRRAMLHFVHVVLPHRPWRYLPDGRTYTGAQPIEGTIGKAWRSEPWHAAHGYQRHLLQVKLVDRLLGDLLARLDAQGLYDESLIVVVADHGVSHRPGASLRVISRATIGDIAAVPLLIKTPGQRRGEMRDDPVETVDVFPTVLDVLGRPAPSGLDGVSLAGKNEARRATKTFFTLKERVTFPVRGIEKWHSLRRKQVVFAAGQGPVDPFRLAPAGTRQLLGRRIGNVPPARDMLVTIAGQDAYRTLDPDAPHVPALVSGMVATRRGGVPTLAVAVNGTIRAVVRAEAGDRAHAFAFRAMVPPRAFRDGRNEVRVLDVQRATVRPIRPARR